MLVLHRQCECQALVAAVGGNHQPVGCQAARIVRKRMFGNEHKVVAHQSHRLVRIQQRRDNVDRDWLAQALAEAIANQPRKPDRQLPLGVGLIADSLVVQQQNRVIRQRFNRDRVQVWQSDSRIIVDRESARRLRGFPPVLG